MAVNKLTALEQGNPSNSSGADVADSVNKIIDGEQLINDLSQAYIFDTVAEYKAFTSEFPVGKRVYLADRDAYFDVIAGTVTATGYKIIASTSVNQSIDLRVGGVVNIKHFGAVGDGATDDTEAINESIAIGGSVLVPDGLFICNDAQGTVNITLYGTGTLKSTAGQKIISFIGCNVTVDGIDFKDDGTAIFTTKLVTTLNCAYVTIRNCFALDVWNIFFEAVLEDTFSGERHLRFIDNRVDCSSAQAAGTVSLNEGVTSFIGGYSGEFNGNYITNIPTNGARWFPYNDESTQEDQRPSNWVISHNTIYRCKRPSDQEGQCVYYRGHYLRMHDNTLSLAGRNVVDVQGPLSQTIPARGIQIHDNTFLNRDDFMTTNAGAIVQLRCCEAIVNDNWFYGAGVNSGFEHDGIRAKWGGTLTATGNRFPLKTIDGFEHVIRGKLIHCSTDSAANAIGFDDITIVGNSGWARFTTSALIQVSSDNTTLIESVAVDSNTVSGAGVLIGMSDTNAQRIRVVNVGANNVVDSAAGIINVSDVAVPWKFSPIDYGSNIVSGLPTDAPAGSTAFALTVNVPVWFSAGAWKRSDGTPA